MSYDPRTFEPDRGAVLRRRPYDSLGELSFTDWKPSYSAAPRISSNLATVATVDDGVSPEDSGLLDQRISELLMLRSRR